MDLWQDLEARYSGRTEELERREGERGVRAALRAEYSAWADRVAVTVLDDLERAIEARREAFGWLRGLPLERLGRGAAAPQLGQGVCVASLRLWTTTLHVYVQRSTDAPPALHFLRQWGGHRTPRMACIPGAWLLKTPTGGYVLHRFDEARSVLSLDDLVAVALSLLLGRAGRS